MPNYQGTRITTLLFSCAFNTEAANVINTQDISRTLIYRDIRSQKPEERKPLLSVPLIMGC